MNKKIILGIAIATALFSSSCKKYLDVNDNPNVARNPDVSQVLPTTEINLASMMGVDMQINGSIWGQFWTQAPLASQYKILEQYSTPASYYDNVWTLFYSSALKNLKYVEQTATTKNFRQYTAISKLLQAYGFQVVTDAWGDVPYSEAGKGDVADGGILNPKYDAQSVIYDGLIKMVDSAIALIDPSDPNPPAGDDLIYGGDMELWMKFANTLKLKLYMRLSEVNPSKAQTGIAAMSQDPTEYIGAGEDAMINFSSTPGNQNPLYSEEVGLGKTQNLVASKTVVDSMNANGDARASALFSTVNGVVVGVQQGNYNTQVSASNPSALVGAFANDANSALAPVKFITSYESLMLLSEASARGWMAGDAQSLFEAAINANFVAYGLDPTDAAAYIAGSNWGKYPTAGSTQDKIKYIITQKWFCMTGNQGFEAWTEWRRTGYPDFFTYSVNSLIGNKFPQRFLYPAGELTRNLNFPGQKQLTDKVWWDIH